MYARRRRFVRRADARVAAALRLRNDLERRARLARRAYIVVRIIGRYEDVDVAPRCCSPSPAIDVPRSAIGTLSAIMAHVPSTISMRDILDATESVCGLYLSSTRACVCCGGTDDVDVPSPFRDNACARGWDGNGGGDGDDSGYELVASACVALSGFTNDWGHLVVR